MVAHAPVLLDEVLEQLAVRPDGLYVDATFGRGGHSRAILQKLGPDGRLIAMDRDPQAVESGRMLAAQDPRFSIEQESFGRLQVMLEQHGISGGVDGIVLDLGVSSPQLDDASRGFSFRQDGPLDMRMDPSRGTSAADWLNAASEREIADVLFRFGEERAARAIARAIVRRRAERPFSTTADLADTVGRVAGRGAGAGTRHPATKTFQAIRIFINDELDELERALPQALDALAIGGRLCVISFHSLEDRRVKRFLRDQARIDPALAKLPMVPESAQPRLRLPAGPIRPGAAEVEANPRARSATLRVGERCR